ncbi:7-methylguanosine phosphate-specific 5'-nucleotidase [Entomophthora muscae]|uniref:7-methylguanosine phosphate-specific 5'-nucleotidase n=1 Tax=Entomophthora muscae TaxID=34485 RepID=A0ACC2SJJ2_9FUNG|nr:7-methylguanosine phosphate-specific 5'-nucleotidase [Entomophthora muscae]
MKSQDMLLPHIHVVSNFMEFDPSPPHQIIGFASPLIHPLNKGTVKLENTPFCEEASKRTNVIVIGDSLGDLQMGSSLNHHTRLTVGILNHNINSKLADFAENFDVVLTNDASFAWLNAILASL